MLYPSYFIFYMDLSFHKYIAKAYKDFRNIYSVDLNFSTLIVKSRSKKICDVYKFC